MPDGMSPQSSYRAYTLRDLPTIPQVAAMPPDLRLQLRAVASVLPFRLNRYVLDRLIDWSRVPDDPIYQLTFPQPGMLDSDTAAWLDELRPAPGASEFFFAAEMDEIRRRRLHQRRSLGSGARPGASLRVVPAGPS